MMHDGEIGNNFNVPSTPHSHTLLTFREAFEVFSSHHEGSCLWQDQGLAPADVSEMPPLQGSLVHAGDVHACCLGVGSVFWPQGSLHWPLPAGWVTVT